MSMVLQQASWDPLNCYLCSLVGLSANQIVWVWFVHRDLLRRQKPQIETTHKHQILCKSGNNYSETDDVLQTAYM
jgi:hypothetical protein